jgi:hypothetical protein
MRFRSFPLSVLCRSGRLQSLVPGFVRGFFALLLVTLAVGNTSCEDKHIGRPCELSIDPDAGSGSAQVATIDVGLECPSRICLYPGAVNGVTTTSLCTADCSSDDDCRDGETRNMSDPTDLRCIKGFSCMVPETVGPFCCRRMCVCKDFLGMIPTGGFPTPGVCTSSPTNKANCQNIQ